LTRVILERVGWSGKHKITMMFQCRIRSWLWLYTMIAAAVFVSGALAAQSIIVTEAQNGATITLAKGDLLIVTLESNPHSGFDWEIAKNDLAMLELSGPPEFRPDVFWMTGSNGHQVFRFHAIASGTETLELEYRRASDKTGARAKIFSVIVAIK
jgi:inhibitor of cysteine peptidase